MAKVGPNFYSYLNLIKNKTPYSQKMQKLSNQIFGEINRQTSKDSMKVVQLLTQLPHHKNDRFINWYPRHVETKSLMMNLRNYGLYRDEHEDWKEEMIRMRALRGKLPYNWTERKYGKDGKKS